MYLDYVLRPRYVLGAPLYHVENTYRIYIPQIEERFNVNKKGVKFHLYVKQCKL